MKPARAVVLAVVFPLALALALGGCSLFLPKQTGRPLPAFPSSSVQGEVDFILEKAKQEFEFKFTGAKVWRVASTQQSFEATPAANGAPEGRQALLNFGFNLDGKCYWQPRLVWQPRLGSSFGDVRIDDNPYADGFYGRGGPGDPFHAETLAHVGLVLPVDCNHMFATGPVKFGPCKQQYEGRKMCEQ